VLARMHLKCASTLMRLLNYGSIVGQCFLAPPATLFDGSPQAVWFVAVLEICSRLDDVVSWGAPLIGDYSHEQLTTVDRLGPAVVPAANSRNGG